jgi:hypothetical protein
MSLKQIPHVRYGSFADIGGLMGVVRFLTVGLVTRPPRQRC